MKKLKIWEIYSSITFSQSFKKWRKRNISRRKIKVVEGVKKEIQEKKKKRKTFKNIVWKWIKCQDGGRWEEKEDGREQGDRKYVGEVEEDEGGRRK